MEPQAPLVGRVAKLDCEIHKKSHENVYLHNLQSLKIPPFCELKTSTHILFGKSDLAIKREYIKHPIKNIDLEQLWPQLANRKVREIVTKDTRTSNVRKSGPSTNVTLNFGIQLKEEL